jgi:hypothetical protein
VPNNDEQDRKRPKSIERWNAVWRPGFHRYAADSITSSKRAKVLCILD